MRCKVVRDKKEGGGKNKKARDEGGRRREGQIEDRDSSTARSDFSTLKTW